MKWSHTVSKIQGLFSGRSLMWTPLLTPVLSIWTPYVVRIKGCQWITRAWKKMWIGTWNNHMMSKIPGLFLGDSQRYLCTLFVTPSPFPLLEDDNIMMGQQGLKKTLIPTWNPLDKKPLQFCFHSHGLLVLILIAELKDKNLSRLNESAMAWKKICTSTYLLVKYKTGKNQEKELQDCSPLQIFLHNSSMI